MARNIIIRRSVVLRATLCALIPVSLAHNAIAQSSVETLEWGLSVRTRFESKQDFNFSDSSQDYLLTQTRLNLSWSSSETDRWFLELQDARIAGEDIAGVPAINEAARGTVFADDLDIHQAFWERQFEPGQLRIGRQKLNFGDARLVASLEWVNTARVHDGVRFTLGDTSRRQIDLFATTLVAVDPDGFNDQSRAGSRYLDSDFHGVYVSDAASLQQAQLHYWYFYRRNSRIGDAVGTLGLRYIHGDRTWRPDIQIAVQDGEFGGQDHSAWMASAGLERDVGSDTFSVAYNMASGDAAPADSEHETFDNLFPLNHPYYGYMDLFSLQNIRNFEVSYTKRFDSGVVLYLALNDFRLAESQDAWYNAGLAPLRLTANTNATHAGHEIDIALQMKLFGGRVDFDVGVSRLRAGDYLAAFGVGGSASFFYASLRYATNW